MIRDEPLQSTTGTWGLSSFSYDCAHWWVSLMVEVLNGGMDGGVEMLDITEGAMGQVVPIQVAPGALDVVQLGGVPGQPLDREPGSRGERLGAGPAGVDRAVIEHQHHGPARPRRLWPVVAVEAGEKISEVARALGSTGDHDE